MMVSMRPWADEVTLGGWGLQEQLSSGSLSHAKTFALKKKIAQERANRIKLQRAVTVL